MGLFIILTTALFPFKAEANLAALAKADELPIFSVETPEKVVALTFNAAWDDADTDTILEILENHGIKASFFLCGIFMENHPELLRRIHAAGHDIGNHGDTHAHVASLSAEANKQEIMGAHKKALDTLGVEMNLFRTPYGEYNATVLGAAKSLGYATIQWDVDSLDWMNRGAEDLVNRVVNSKKLRNGSIILFHTDAKHTAAVLDRIISELKAKGYGFAPVSQIIYKSGYKLDTEGRQWKNPPGV